MKRDLLGFLACCCIVYARDGGGTGAGTAVATALYVDCNACPAYPAPQGAEIDRDNPTAAADAAVCCATTLAYVLVLCKKKMQSEQLGTLFAVAKFSIPVRGLLSTIHLLIQLEVLWIKLCGSRYTWGSHYALFWFHSWRSRWGWHDRY